MKNIFNILIFSAIINITQAQVNIEILKQIVQSADLFQDFPIIKFIDTNKNLNDTTRYTQISYYRDRFKAWKNIQTVTSGVIKFKKDNVVGRSYDVIQIDQKTGKPVPSFCMFGGRDAAIYTYQVLKIGQTMYLCHQWYNELWKPVHNEWGISSVIIKHDSFQDRAIMFFLDKEKKSYVLPCGVASALYEKKNQKIVLTFFDRKNQLTELNNEEYRISKIEASCDNDNITCYLNDKKIDMQWSKIGNWREMMIYNLWTYGNGIDWKN